MLFPLKNSLLSTLDPKILETQSNTKELDLELDLLNLKSILESTIEEQSDIIDKGFSFSASLKDISRFITTNLYEQLIDTKDIFYIINNWQRFVKALDDNSLVTTSELNLFNTFTNVYYNSIDYFKKQFLTHLGEKVEFAAENTGEAAIDHFVKTTGFRQRRFNYKLEQEGISSIEFVTSSTIRRYEIKSGEREKVEMFNSLFLRFIFRPYEAESLLLTVAQKFPYLEIELTELYLKTIEFMLEKDNTFIEISPPFENYSYQNECMVRIFKYNGIDFDVYQYSVPYIEEELSIVHENIVSIFDAKEISTTYQNNYGSNNILNRFFCINKSDSFNFINSFPSVVELGGVKMFNSVADIINPKIESIGNKITPYLVEYINQPSFLQDSISFRQSIDRYKQIFLTTIATLDVNIQNKNPLVDQILQSGELLDTVLRGENPTELLNNASNGEVNQIEVSSEGYCDLTTGVIGGVQDVKSSYTEVELSSMVFKGNVMSLTKDGDLKLDLMKFIDSKGNERKLFLCPTCSANGITNYIDICNESCPKCDVLLKDLRIAAEKGNLSSFVENFAPAYKSSITNNGLFGVLFDLFGAVVDLF